MKIQICKKFKKVNKLQKKLALTFPSDSIVIKKCIDMCDVCKNTPTTKLKGKRYKAERISTLISKLKKLYT